MTKTRGRGQKEGHKEKENARDMAGTENRVEYKYRTMGRAKDKDKNGKEAM